MVSLKGLLNTDIRYPGIEIKVELIVMHEYLNQMEAGIKAVCDAYLTEEINNYTDTEYHEYQHIYHIAEDKIPRIIRLPFAVSIYTLFENSITQLLSYAQDKEGKGLKIKDINGKSLACTFNKYMKHVLDFDFQISNTAMEDISNLNKVRNCITHSNGNLTAMSKEKIAELEKLEKSAIGIELTSMQIDVSYDFLKTAMTAVEKIVRALMDFLEARYGFN